VLLLLGLFSFSSCNSACDNYFVGQSSLNHQVASNWRYGNGTAAGVWELSLFPVSYGTNCVDLDEGEYDSEAYDYTLEFVVSQEAEVMNVYVNGTLFATGTYSDETSEDVADQIAYETGERIDDTRPAGTISYVISGSAKLEANTSAGTLTWYGDEYIEVVDSGDPNIRIGCTFHYDATGTKVCDE
jgi:hypothetical protein